MARGSVNKVILIGTLGRDPESRYMPNGNAVCNISLATDEGYSDKNTGQRIDRTEWHRVVAYGRLAEIMAQYLRKGSKAYIEGRLQTREWEKDGIKRYSTEIIANEMNMLDAKPHNSMDEHAYSQAPQQGGMNPNMQNTQSGFVGGGHSTSMHPHNTQPANAGHLGGGQSTSDYGQPPSQGHPNPAHQPSSYGSGQQPMHPGGATAQPQQAAPQGHDQQRSYGGGGSQQGTGQHPPQPAPAGTQNFDDFDDDIPF